MSEPSATRPGRAPGADPRPVRFGPDKVSLLPVALAVFCAVPLALSSPLLTWLLLLPVAAAVWVVRARVVVTPDALLVCNGLGTARHRWDEVDGFDVPPRRPLRLRPVRVRLVDGTSQPLTALVHRELPLLLRAASPSASGA